MSIFNPFDFKSARVVATRRLYHLEERYNIDFKHEFQQKHNVTFQNNSSSGRTKQTVKR